MARRPARHRLAGALALLLAVVTGGPAANAQGAARAPAEAEIQGDELIAAAEESVTGDLADIRARNRIRFLVSYTKTNFFFADGALRGFEHDLAKQYVAWLDRSRPRGAPPLAIVFIPVAFDELIPALRAGRGDIVAANMTVTPARAAAVGFAAPYIDDVREVVVTTRDHPPITTLDGLADEPIVVLRGSSFAEHLRTINDERWKAGRKPIEVVEAAPSLQTEDLLELVSAGVIRRTVADDHIAEVWADVLPNIAIQKDVAIAEGRRIAWAVRSEDAALRESISAFVATAEGRPSADRRRLFASYYEDPRWVKNPFEAEASGRTLGLIKHFREVADRHRWDWLLLLAQGFQESGLDPAARSPVGALGVMQLMPATGAELGVRDLLDPGQNIAGGGLYLDRLRNTYFDDPAIGDTDRLLFALAAYNAGPGRIAKLRALAAARGNDPNRWFRHVELVALGSGLSETVRYVGNINQYYVAYRLAEEALILRRQREDILAGAGTRPDKARAIDGDSVLLASGEIVRLVDIDTPELDCRCLKECELARRAQVFTQARIDQGFALTKVGTDRYGRALVRIRAGGEDLARGLVRSGLARPYQVGQPGWCQTVLRP